MSFGLANKPIHEFDLISEVHLDGAHAGGCILVDAKEQRTDAVDEEPSLAKETGCLEFATSTGTPSRTRPVPASKRPINPLSMS
jgi:hypothetical protein